MFCSMSEPLCYKWFIQQNVKEEGKSHGCCAGALSCGRDTLVASWQNDKFVSLIPFHHQGNVIWFLVLVLFSKNRQQHISIPANKKSG